MLKKALSLLVFLFFFFSLVHLGLHAEARAKRLGGEDVWGDYEFRPLVRKTQMKTLAENEYGQISAVNISDGIRGPYHIQFFTLEPNSLFLPVLLHADMILYVHTGSGRLSYVDEEETKSVHLRRGDIFRLQTGSIFFAQSDLEPERESLRIYALFSNTDDELFEPAIGAYSSIRNLVRGFDKLTLMQAFKVPDEVIESIISAPDAEAIVHAISTKKDKKEKKKDKTEKKKKASMWEMEARFLKAFLGGEEDEPLNKKKKSGVYNLLDEEPDFENCNGWSLTVNREKAAHILQGTNIGLFMVNLTKGSMMGPHWNPKATEIAIVLHGQGMIRVVCSSRPNKSKHECKNVRFRVKEGDVFAVPRFHPMAQISFNNDSLVFMGFTTTKEENYPQFLAGKQSVLQTLDKDILALSFNVSNTTIDQLLVPQADSIILDCTSCAEEEERIMEEEIEKEKEEQEARKREKEEEERRKREEEEERKREEEERKREEEEKRRQEEEERKREEEERKREEEEARKREEEEARRREEEEERRREEERQRQEEEERERQREEEERRQEEERERQEVEEKERQREEEERRQEEERQRQEEEERARQREEEERQQEEEEDREREREQEEARRREEERERERQQEEEGGGGGERKAYLKMWTV